MLTSMSESFVRAQGIKLRALKREDLPQLWAWYQNPDLMRHLVGTFRYRSETDALAYMERWLQTSETEVRCAIEEIDTGQLIGMTFLTGIDKIHSHGEAHCFLGDVDIRGKGWGRTALAMMLDHAFYDLGLHRMYVELMVTNQAAFRMDSSVGFLVEGTKKEAAFKDGRWVDVICMGMTEERYFEVHGRPGDRQGE